MVRSEPDNLRALSYYGLSLLRAGRLVEARPILLRAGQTELVAEVDQKLSTQPPSPEMLPERSAQNRRGIVEPLVEEPQLPTAPPLADVLSQVTIGEAPALFSLTSDGLLLIRVVGMSFCVARAWLPASERSDFVPLGDENSDGGGQVPELLFRAEGRGDLLLSPQGGRFTPLSLVDGEELCLAPHALLACSSSLLRDPRVLPRSEGELPCFCSKVRASWCCGRRASCMRCLCG